MKKKTLEFLEAHKSETPSTWREEAEWRRDNWSWLRHSQKIAVKVCRNIRANRCQMGRTDIGHVLSWGYLSAPVQLDLFETANITLDVPYRLNQKNWNPPTWVYKRFSKRIETVFSQLNDYLMMIRNYAKQLDGLFARMAAKVV